MNFDTIIYNLKNFVFIAFPLGIAMTYIGVSSYYLNYNIDISTYLGFEDLTIIYSKYTIFSMIYLFIIYVALNKLFRENNKERFWDKTIFNTVVKRRIIPGAIFTIILIYCFFKYDTLRIIISIVILSIILFRLTRDSIYNSLILNQTEDEHEKQDNIISVIFWFIITIILIPLLAGNLFDKMNTRESIIIKLEDNKTIDAQKYSTIKFIGKTSKFIFFKDLSSKSTIVYPIDKISEIEYCN